MTTTKEVQEMQDNDLARRYPNMTEEDRLIQGAIDRLNDGEWVRGWGDGDRMCILQSVNMAAVGKPRYSTRAIPVGVIRRIHDVLHPGEKLPARGGKETLASGIMAWNDGFAKDKKQVIAVLKKALKLKSEEQ